MKLQGYERVQVKQKNLKIGCIPAGIEWMIRYRGIAISDIENFQERFNLEERHEGENNFATVSKAAEEEYDQLKSKFRHLMFRRDQGKEKLEEIGRSIQSGTPCLLSLIYLNKKCNTFACHITPVVEIDKKNVYLLFLEREIGKQLDCFSRDDLEQRHKDHEGGNDILQLL